MYYIFRTIYIPGTEYVCTWYNCSAVLLLLGLPIRANYCRQSQGFCLVVVDETKNTVGKYLSPILFERSEFLIATCEKKKLTVCVCVYVRQIAKTRYTFACLHT